MPRVVLVLPLVSLRVGESFAVAEWPLHITVVAPFLTDADPAELAAAVAAVAPSHPPLRLVAEHDELFGRLHTVPVTVMGASAQLATLRGELIDALLPFATRPDEPAFTGEHFRPHITWKNGSRVHEGDEFTLTQLALVDMAPRAAVSGRTVLATSELSGG